jgi:hypothetical protein
MSRSHFCPMGLNSIAGLFKRCQSITFQCNIPSLCLFFTSNSEGIKNLFFSVPLLLSNFLLKSLYNFI